MDIRVFEDKKLVIASHNTGKVIEIRELLKPLNIEIISASELQVKEPIEDGLTFEENVLMTLIINLVFIQQDGLENIKILILQW